MYGRALAYQEVIDFVDSSKERIEAIRRRLETVKVDQLIRKATNGRR